jgi:2-oxoisovalerate dehydrogenase E1 component
MTVTSGTSLELIEMYRSMVLIRRFEELVLSLRRERVVSGSVHLCAGQEAIPVGACSALGRDDRVVATYRGHGWALASGVPLGRLLAEVCHKETGVNGGRGGSAHLIDPEHGFLGENSIVGAGVPIADGAALASQIAGTGRVVLASFGDGATSQGATHEGLVFAVYRRLPVVFVCENNGWSEMTPIGRIVPVDELSARAPGYGLPGITVDGTDPTAVAQAVSEATARARGGEGPTLIEARCHRLWGHYNADVEHYRSREDRLAAREADPVAALRRRLLKSGVDESELDDVDREVSKALDDTASQVLTEPNPDPVTAARHVYAPAALATAGDRAEEQPLSYVKAVNEALRRELSSRAEVIVYGEDVGHAGGIFGVTKGLQDQFGKARVFDAPIAEASILGSAIGAALEGLRPVVEIMWGDFLLVALDQLINQAANVRYVTEGRYGAPVVVRTQQGATPGSCAQHSQSLEALLAHIPGLRVGVASTPQDAYSMLRAAVADDDPVVLFEARSLYQDQQLVQLGGPIETVSGARLRRDGDDVTIISWGPTATKAVEAASMLADRGIAASVLDLRWLAPLDEDAIAETVGRTKRVVIAHEANVTGGFGGEVAARVGERFFGELAAPVRRVGVPDSRIPPAPALQDALIPSRETIVEAVCDLVRWG